MNTAVKAMPIMSILWGLSQKYRKGYSYPSQRKIIELLKKRYGIKISIATINRWLLKTEQAGYIKRTRRIRRDKHLGMVFKSTLYEITWVGYKFLVNSGMAAWNEIKSLGARVKEKVKRKSKKKTSKSPGVSGYFMMGSGLMEEMSKIPKE